MSDINFEVSRHIDTGGTKKVGEITTTYNHLVETFGKPTAIEPDNKTQVEWRMEFSVPAESDPEETDYVIAAVYDYNMAVNPVKRPGDKLTFMIGGNSMDAAYYVHLVLGE